MLASDMAESAIPTGASEPVRARIGNFPLRVLTAAVGIPLVVGTVWTGGWLLTAVVAIACAIAVLEVQLVRHHVTHPFALIAGGVAALLPISAKLGLDDVPWAFTIAVMLPLAALSLSRDPKEGVQNWLWAAGPAVYVGWLAAHFVLLRGVPDGRDWVLVALLTVWITDSGAYFVGKPLGRHKLAPHISPGKTWEGAVGGQIAGFVAFAGLVAAFDLNIETMHVIALGLIVPTVAQAGDLAESAVKRGLGVKDSSGLVPGHGGILDRMDSLLFAAPAVYWYLRWLVL
jgi:phosphatidate cytidylyltransferase